MKMEIVKIYAKKKPEIIHVEGDISGSRNTYEEIATEELKKHKIRNVGRFLMLLISEYGIWISEYNDGIKIGKDTTIYIDKETIDLLYKESDKVR